MFVARLVIALALAAPAAPLRAEPALVRRHVRFHAHRAHHRLGHLHYGIIIPLLPPPPTYPYEPYGVPPFGPEIFPREKGKAGRGAPVYAAPFGPSNTLPEGMAITVRKTLRRNGDGDAKISAPIDRPIQAVKQLATCWSPPLPQKGETVEATIRFSFNSRGMVIGGAPRVTYVKPAAGMSADEVRQSILAAVKDCTPIRFSASMAESMPGYPLSVRFVGQRAGDKPGPN